MDIFIARLAYPNDPGRHIDAHQHFLAVRTPTSIKFFSVSSILGKEYRVFGSESYKYYPITGKEQTDNGFRVPSFIDCSEMFEISLDTTVDINKLNGRDITQDLKDNIFVKAADLQRKGELTTYSISVDDLKRWNPRVVV